MTLIDTSEALENQFGLADRIVDESALANSVARFRERGIRLPRFAELADPSSFDHAGAVGDADPQGPDARSLSEKVARIVMSYTDFVNQYVWNKPNG